MMEPIVGALVVTAAVLVVAALFWIAFAWPEECAVTGAVLLVVGVLYIIGASVLGSDTPAWVACMAGAGFVFLAMGAVAT